MMEFTCDRCGKEFEAETVLFCETYHGTYSVNDDGVIEGEEANDNEYCFCPECEEAFKEFMNNK